MTALLKFEAADENPADGHFRTVNGTLFGEPHRYRVFRKVPYSEPEFVGWVYKRIVHVMGATYISWFAEAPDGTSVEHPSNRTFYTRTLAGEALEKRL